MVLKPRQLVKIIETKITKFIELIMWHNKFILTIIKGKINGKIWRGRSRDSTMGNLGKKLALLSYEAGRILAEKRRGCKPKPSNKKNCTCNTLYVKKICNFFQIYLCLYNLMNKLTIRHTWKCSF